MMFNDNNQILFPYLTSSNTIGEGSIQYLMLLLANFESSIENGKSNINLTSTRVITIPEQETTATMHSIQSIGDYFFIIGGDYVYRIDTEGNIETVYAYDHNTNPPNDGIYNIVKQENTLYGIGLSHLFVSTDQGLTWETVSNIPTQFRHLNYTHLGETLLAYRNSQIWEVTLTQDNVQARELDREGLEGKMITSITEFDDQIFVTTLSGVFSKEKSRFFDGK